MIPFEEIDNRLRELGKDRTWLAEKSQRSPDSIRAALAPNARPKSRSVLLQKALSDVIEVEEQLQREPETESKLPPGYSAIFLSDEELDAADEASRLVQAKSLAMFCHDVIQAEAKRIIREHAERLATVEKVVPMSRSEEGGGFIWLDFLGGVAAGAPIPSDITPHAMEVPAGYDPDIHSVHQAFGDSALPKVRDRQYFIVEKLPEGHYPKQGKIVVYSDGHGRSLKVFGYRKAKPGEEGNVFGKVVQLSSLNPAFPDVQAMDGGRIESVLVDTL